MRQQMDDFIYGVLDQQRGNANWNPSIDVDEDEKGFTVRMGVPGWEDKDVNVEVAQNVLTIRGHQENSEKSSSSQPQNGQRRWRSSFSQSLNLPANIDAENITAELDKGLLTVYLPKKAQAAPKNIEITCKK
jgi:HSP20 family protein